MNNKPVDSTQHEQQPDQEMEKLQQNYEKILSSGHIHYPRTYEFIRELGHGRQGAVMLGRHHGARGCVTERAIKVMNPALYRNPGEYWTDMGRIASQVSKLQRLNTTTLAATHTYEETYGIGYVEMDVIDGIDLHHLLSRELVTFVHDKSQAWECDQFQRTIFREVDGHHCLQPGLVVHIMRGALRGLERLHEIGFLHYDIKPANIMIDRLGNVRLVDFGRAVKVGEHLSFLLGSPRYMSPEAHSRKPCNIHSDIYSLGLVSIKMLAGNKFSEAMPDTEEDVVQFKMNLSEQLHEILPADVVENDALFNIIRRMVDPDPNKRFSSAKEAETGNNSLSLVTKQLIKVGLDSEYERDIADYLSKLIDTRTQRVEPPKNIIGENSNITR
ncbi:MAG: serine/threonine protein kinase [Kiritimatiellae bacterium]|nr:serine/threonine protein kinase [Kiritimatiellia bacterium]